MSHVLSEFFGGTGNFVIDLRRQGASAVAPGPAPYYKATKLKITAIAPGMSATTFLVCPVVVNDTDAAPSGTSLSIPASPANINGVAQVDSGSNPTLEIGQQYSPGYSAEVFREVTATHLLVTCVNSGILQVIVD